MKPTLSGPLFSESGRKKIAEHYEQKAYDLIVKKANGHITSLRCLVHGETPETVIMTEPDGSHGLHVKGCCDQIIAEAEALLRNIDLSEL